jgi:hypothetical protein
VRVEHLSVVEAEWFLIEHLIEEKGRDSGTVQNYRGVKRPAWRTG